MASVYLKVKKMVSQLKFFKFRLAKIGNVIELITEYIFASISDFYRVKLYLGIGKKSETR